MQRNGNHGMSKKFYPGKIRYKVENQGIWRELYKMKVGPSLSLHPTPAVLRHMSKPYFLKSKSNSMFLTYTCTDGNNNSLVS